MKKILILLCIYFCVVSVSRGDHLMGGEITYEHIGAGDYIVTLKVYRDCRGVGIGHSTLKLRGSSQEFIDFTFTPQNVFSVRDISGIDPDCPNPSSCKGGNSPYGVEEHTWSYLFYLGGSCEWTISWFSQLRSATITTGQQSQPFYISSTLNRCIAGENSSPVYTQVPVAYICYNQDFQYNMGAMDPIDGDSLSFALDTAMQDSITYCNYSSQTSPLRPLRFLGHPNENQPYPGGFRLSPTTGDLLFRPVAGQVGVVVIEVTEWRKDGNGTWQVIGRTKRDMQIAVLNCGTNKPPTFSYLPLQWNLCANDSVCINIETSDENQNDSTFIYTSGGINGASYTTNNGLTQRASLQFCWKPKSSDIRTEPHLFYVRAEDNSCPKKGENLRSVQIFVTDTNATTISAGADTTALSSDSIRMRGLLQGLPGQLGVWRSLGNGYFKDSASQSALYFPGSQDIQNCEVKLVYTANTISLCAENSDTMLLSLTTPFLNSPNDSFGVGGDTVKLFANNSNGGQSVGEYWISLGDGYFIDSSELNPVYHFGAGDLKTCEVKFVLADLARCTDHYDTITVFRSEDSLYAGVDQHGVFSDSVSLSGQVPFRSNNRGTRWVTMGDGFFKDTNTLNTTYYLGPNDLLNCDIKIILTQAQTVSCIAQYDTLTVYRSETAPDAGADQYAVSADSVQLGGTTYHHNNRQTRWSSMGDGHFKDAMELNTIYYPGPNDLLSCDFKLSLTHQITSGCFVNSDTIQVFRNEPGPNAGPDLYNLIGDSVQLNATVYAFNNRQSYWASLGDGHFTDPYNINTYYHFGLNDRINCTVNITLSNGITSSCFKNADTLFLSNSYPPVNAGTDINWFPGDSIHLSGVSDTANKQFAYWSSTGDGIFSNVDNLNAWYHPGTNDRASCAEIKLGLTSYATGICAVSNDTLSLLKIEKNIHSGGSANRLLQTQFSLNGVSDTANGQYASWTSLGDGHFDDSFMASTNYVLGPNDTKACRVRLLFTSYGNGNCDTKTDTFSIIQLPVPVNVHATFDSLSIDTIHLSTSPVSDYITWTSNGSGTFKKAHPVHYIPSEADKYINSLVLKASRYHCGLSEDSVDINTLKILAVENLVQFEKDFIIYPNPTENRVRIQPKTGIILSRMEVYDSKGSKLIVQSFENQTEYVIEMSSLLPGNYVMRLIAVSGEQYSIIVQKR